VEEIFCAAHNKPIMLSPTRPSALMKSTTSSLATNFSKMNLDNCSGLKGKQGFRFNALKPTSVYRNVINSQLIKRKQDHNIKIKERAWKQHMCIGQ
jgi:hypothetical protein